MISDTVVELSNVSVEYRSTGKGVLALAGVNLIAERHTMTAVVGRSGSGKSTLLSVLALMRAPTSGGVRFEGREVSSLTHAQQARLRGARIGIVFQSFHLEPTLTAAENVMLPWFTGVVSGSYSDARTRVREVLSELSIEGLGDRRQNEMSGGQRQRVAIARALFGRPSLVLADEPTGNLDEATADDVSKLLAEVPRRFGSAVIVVTHDNEVAKLADRCITLREGAFESEFIAAEA